MATIFDKLVKKLKEERQFFKKHPFYENYEENIKFDEDENMTIQAINHIKKTKTELFKVKTMLHFKNDKIYFHITNLSKTYDYKAVILINKETLELVFEKEILNYDSKILQAMTQMINENVRASIRQQLRDDFHLIVEKYFNPLEQDST
jgi:hypothetical protein